MPTGSPGLTGAGTSARREQEMINTMCSNCIDSDRLPDRTAFDAEVDAFVDWVKASPLADPNGEVLVPGDIERRTRAQRLMNGIALDDTTVGEITEAAVSVGMARAEIEQSFAAARIDSA